MLETSQNKMAAFWRLNRCLIDEELSRKFSDEKQKCVVGESILRPSRNVEKSHEMLRPAIKDNNQLNSDQKTTLRYGLFLTVRYSF